MTTRTSTSAALMMPVVLGFALLSTLASASTDPSYHGGAGASAGEFTYSQAFQLDLSSDIEESYNKQAEDSSSLDQQPLSDIESEVLLYETESGGGGCFVSSRTIMEEPTTTTTSKDYGASSSLWSIGGERNFQNEASSALFQGTLNDFEVDSDDDDDDNDDGHSSMLSNASLRKSVVNNSNNNNNSIQRRSGDDSTATETSPKRQSTAIASSHVALLNLRGGGGVDFKSMAATALHSEISKKLIVTALVTLVFEATMGHIFEFLKIVMQTAEKDMTYAKVVRSITAEKGIAGLWDGFCPWGIVQAVFKGAVFGLAHASALQTLVPLAEKGKIPMALALTLAGGIGGGFQGYVLSPTLLLKTRVMTNPVFREKMSMLRTTLLSFRIGYDVVKTEGFSTLMKGSNVFATKRVFDWASRYFFADLFEALFSMLKNNEPLSVAEKSASSLLGGVFSTLVTLPLDVLVAKTQDAKKAGVKVSALKLFQDELREKGLSGLRNAYMRGFEARLLHVCLTTLVIKTGTPIAYEALFGTTK